jgi:hypothetical protein
VYKGEQDGLGILRAWGRWEKPWKICGEASRWIRPSCIRCDTIWKYLSEIDVFSRVILGVSDKYEGLVLVIGLWKSSNFFGYMSYCLFNK